MLNIKTNLRNAVSFLEHTFPTSISVLIYLYLLSISSAITQCYPQFFNAHLRALLFEALLPLLFSWKGMLPLLSNSVPLCTFYRTSWNSSRSALYHNCCRTKEHMMASVPSYLYSPLSQHFMVTHFKVNACKISVYIFLCRVCFVLSLMCIK